MADSKHEENVENKKSSKFIGLLILLIVITVIWVVGGRIVWSLFPDMQSRGSFGDMFGSINSLFAGLAFAGVIYTIFLQRQELALQRKELELTRKELKRSAEAQEKSQEALAEQVSAQLLTAKLNAFSTLVDYYSTEYRGISGNLTPARQAREKASQKTRAYLGQLETLAQKIRT